MGDLPRVESGEGSLGELHLPGLLDFVAIGGVELWVLVVDVVELVLVSSGRLDVHSIDVLCKSGGVSRGLVFPWHGQRVRRSSVLGSSDRERDVLLLLRNLTVSSDQSHDRELFSPKSGLRRLIGGLWRVNGGRGSIRWQHHHFWSACHWWRIRLLVRFLGFHLLVLHNGGFLILWSYSRFLILWGW